MFEDTTKEYSSHFPELQYTAWPSGQLASIAGFGTYRIGRQDPEHQISLMKALMSGINVIDTSANYSDGESERAIGEVLKHIKHDIKRSDLIVISKLGYIEGASFTRSEQRKAEQNPYPEAIELEQGSEYCIHPECLEEQLNESLKRLQIDYLDVLLIHNPEMFLMQKQLLEGKSLEEIRDMFYKKIAKAFEWLESAVEKGLIRSYGISSNTFALSADNPDLCSLERCLNIAESIKKDHHFHVIQFPFNLIETEAATELNQEDESLTLIEYAEAHDIVCLVNRPLNAMRNNTLIRLSDNGFQDGIDEQALIEDIYQIAMASDTFVRNIDILPYDQKDRDLLVDLITSVAELQTKWRNFSSMEEWHTYRNMMLSSMALGLTAINKLQDESMIQWSMNMAKQLASITNTINTYNVVKFDKMAQRNVYIHSALEKAFPGNFTGQPLSQIAFNAVRTVKGISSVLIGARNQLYIDDVLEAMQKNIPVLDRVDWMGMKLH